MHSRIQSQPRAVSAARVCDLIRETPNTLTTNLPVLSICVYVACLFIRGAGEGDGGSLGAMITRTSPLDKGVAGLPSVLDPAPYRSNFSHSTETSQPGYYSSFLPDVNTLAELTAASGGMAGLHRYTCNSTSSHLGPCVLLLDGCHTTHDGPCGPGSMTLTNATNGVWTLSASLTEDGSFGRKCGGTPIFLYGSITATLTPARAGTWADGKLSAGAGTVASNGSTGQLGAWLEYSPIAGASVVITLRVAVSYVSLAGAAGNFAAQLANGTASFDGSRGAASSDWEAVLNTVSAAGATDIQGGTQPFPYTSGWSRFIQRRDVTTGFMHNHPCACYRFVDRRERCGLHGGRRHRTPGSNGRRRGWRTAVLGHAPRPRSTP